MRCMRLCLDDKTYRALMKTYCEFVVSCGSAAAPVNVFMSKENNAKNIVIMKPDMAAWLGKFSIAIIPRHDRPPRAKNVVETMIAPNLIDEEALKRDGEKLKDRVGLKKDKTIGVFIGGDNPEFSLTKDDAASVIDSLVAFSDSHDAELLVTTSRRTSAQAEEAIKERLKGNPRCRLLVVANEKNLDEAVGGILGLGKVIVVSGESISMISEAVSAGKKAVVFALRKKTRGVTKHERALEDLEKEGYIIAADPAGLPSAIEKAFRDTAPRKELKDREKIFEAVRRLI